MGYTERHITFTVTFTLGLTNGSQQMEQLITSSSGWGDLGGDWVGRVGEAPPPPPPPPAVSPVVMYSMSSGYLAAIFAVLPVGYTDSDCPRHTDTHTQPELQLVINPMLQQVLD